MSTEINILSGQNPNLSKFASSFFLFFLGQYPFWSKVRSKTCPKISASQKNPGEWKLFRKISCWNDMGTINLQVGLQTTTGAAAMPTMSVSACPFTPKHICLLLRQSHPIPSHPNTHALFLVSLIVSLHTQTHMPFTLSVSLCPFTPKHTCPLPCQSHCVLSHPNTHALFLVSLIVSLHTQTHKSFTLSVSSCPFTPKHTCPLPCQSHCVLSHPNTHALYLVSLIVSFHTQTHMPFTLSVSLCPFTPKHTCPLPCQSHCVLSHPNTHALYLVSLTLSLSPCPFTPKHTYHLPAWLVSLTLPLHTQTHIPFTCMTCQSHPAPSHPNTHALTCQKLPCVGMVTAPWIQYMPMLPCWLKMGVVVWWPLTTM